MSPTRAIAEIVIDFIPLPGGATVFKVLTSMYELIKEVRDGKATYLALHTRLKQIFEKLQEIEANGGLKSEAVTQFTTTLGKYWAELDAYKSMRSVERLLHHKKTKEAIASINESVDQLFQMVGLATASVIVDWRGQYEIDMDRQYHMLVQLAEDTQELLDEVRGLGQKLDMTVVLKAEVDKINARKSELPDEAQKAVRAALHAIVVNSAGEVKVEPTPKWFVLESDVDFDEVPFARGSFATVHRGRFMKQTRVVVKRLAAGEYGFNEALKASFLNEADRLFDARHPHIVAMMGGCHVSQRPFIICEEAANGSMKDYLSGDPTTRRQYVWRLVHEASQGLAYLHSKHIIHGDVRLANVLVTEAIHARLADFGFSRVKTKSNSKSMTKRKDGDIVVGNYRWLAPEVFTNLPQFESDVWAMAMLVIEAFTGEPPHAEVRDENEVKQRVMRGERPTRPLGMSDRVWELIVDMTHARRTDRIKIGEVVKRLEALAKDEPAPQSYIVEDGPAEPSTPIVVDTPTVLEGLKNGSTETKIDAARRLAQATASPAYMEHFLTTACVRVLVNALEDAANQALKEPLVLALANFAQDERGAELIALRGGVALLATLLFETNERLRDPAFRALVALMRDPMNAPVFLRAKGVEGLERHLNNISPNARAGVLTQLSEIFSSSAKVAAAAASHPPLLDACVGNVSSRHEDERNAAGSVLKAIVRHEAGVRAIHNVGGFAELMKLAKQQHVHAEKAVLDAFETLLGQPEQEP